MNRFELDFAIKGLPDDRPGEFEGLASTYGNTDLVGDVVLPGAFSKTIEERGRNVPVLWQHRQDCPIGTGTLTDSGAGLKLVGRLVLDVKQAAECYALMKAGAVKGLSIGYEVIKDRMAGDVRELLEVRLWEVSLVTFPANPLAQVTAVKTAAERELLASWREFLADVKATTGRVDHAASERELCEAFAAFTREVKAATRLHRAGLR